MMRTIDYFMQLTGFKVEFARKMLKKAEVKSTRRGNLPALYSRAELDVLAAKLLIKMTPPKANEWSRRDICRHLGISRFRLNKITLLDSFPKPHRVFMPMTDGNHIELWDADIIRKIDINSVVNALQRTRQTADRDIDVKPFVFNLSTNLMLQFNRGDYAPR